MVEAVYKEKKINVEIQNKKKELKKELTKKTENKAAYRHELGMTKEKQQKIEL